MNELRSLYRMQESIWPKKSRVQGCKLGDKNTRFFHLSATRRKNTNAILSLSSLLPNGIDSSFITLIPKIVVANKLKDF
jgi:hypothetical protein